MVRKSKGTRRKTRSKLRMWKREKFSVNRYLQEFKKGEVVVVRNFPQSHRGFPDPKFMGKVGKVVEKRGRAYVIKIKDGGKEKTIISRPEHLRGV